jgi:hypothetical protein
MGCAPSTNAVTPAPTTKEKETEMISPLTSSPTISSLAGDKAGTNLQQPLPYQFKKSVSMRGGKMLKPGNLNLQMMNSSAAALPKLPPPIIEDEETLVSRE